nr:hypothetical protein [Roseimaritima sediminicola]
MVFVNDRFKLGRIPYLIPLRRWWFKRYVIAASTTTSGLAGDNRCALFAGNEFAQVPLVAFLATLFSLLSRHRLPLGLRVRMFGARRQGRVAWSEFLDLIDERFNLVFKFVDSLFIAGHQSLDKIACWLSARRQFDARLGLAHRSIWPEIVLLSPEQFSNSAHRAVNG